jgi:hypothetical protein
LATECKVSQCPTQREVVVGVGHSVIERVRSRHGEESVAIVELDVGVLEAPPGDAPPMLAPMSRPTSVFPGSTLLSSVPTLEESVPTLLLSVPTLDESVPTLSSSVPTLDESVPTQIVSVPTLDESVPTQIVSVQTLTVISSGAEKYDRPGVWGRRPRTAYAGDRMADNSYPHAFTVVSLHCAALRSR